MKSRATCILLIEVWTTLIYHPWCRHDIISFSSRILFNFALQIFWALGTVFEVLLAILVMPTLGWRWLLGLSTIPLFIFSILCFVSMMLSVWRPFCNMFSRTNESFVMSVCLVGWEQWLPESARYDVLTGNQEKALATLKRIATENGAPMPLGKLIAARQVTDSFFRASNSLNIIHVCSQLCLFMSCFFQLGRAWKDPRLIFIRLSLDHSSAVVYLVNGVNDDNAAHSHPESLLTDFLFFLAPNIIISKCTHKLISVLFEVSHHHRFMLCLWLLRFANAFSYYGLVLLTTELFQEGGACGSESLLQHRQLPSHTQGHTHTHF